MAHIDGRRRPYVPVDVFLAFDDFGTKLLDKWGLEGIGTWVLFLAACKREPVEGQFVYGSDDEAWGKLGAKASNFTLDEFFKWCGSQRKTSRRRHGRISYVSVSQWEKWNKRPPNPRNPRKSQENTDELRENPPEYNRFAPPKVEVGTTSRELQAEVAGSVQHHLDLLVESLPDADDGTMAVLQSYARRLDEATVANIRSRARGQSVKWVVGALRSEAEGAAA